MSMLDMGALCSPLHLLEYPIDVLARAAIWAMFVERADDGNADATSVLGCGSTNGRVLNSKQASTGTLQFGYVRAGVFMALMTELRSRLK
ncbi:hypothetical protein cyc_01035 [Cyclospora cayetanensis]|uniref:Uncharacterized protein n=1 Tax=Cyclospora cayetanensis TaxID=88456 RepID=A0A1D3DAP7_9EIME|nr:hypothetical protein cyc_01035 [Cyclospora cayetanensis]